MMALEIILLFLAVPAVAASGYLLLATLLSAKPAAPKKSRGPPFRCHRSGAQRSRHDLNGLSAPCSASTGRRTVNASLSSPTIHGYDGRNRARGGCRSHAAAIGEPRQGLCARIRVRGEPPQDLGDRGRCHRRRRGSLPQPAGVFAAQYLGLARMPCRFITVSEPARLVADPPDHDREGLVPHCALARARETRRVLRIRKRLVCNPPVVGAGSVSLLSLTEDLEYGIAIGMCGFRVAYADEAHSNADMVSGELSHDPSAHVGKPAALNS